MECCKASQFSNDAGARIWQAADVGYLALRYGAWLTWACLTLQLSSHLVPLLLQESSHLVPLLLQESSLHFLSFLLKLLTNFSQTCAVKHVLEHDYVNSITDQNLRIFPATASKIVQVTEYRHG